MQMLTLFQPITVGMHQARPEATGQFELDSVAMMSH